MADLHFKRIISDGTTDVPVDSHASGLKTISTPHHETHGGRYFIFSHIFDDVDDAANADLHVIVGAGKELHAVISIASEGKGEIRLYSGTTYTGAGTAVTPYDKNRTTANTSNATAKHTPTVDALGTAIYVAFAPGGEKVRSIGGVRSNGEEWILKKSTDYLVRFTNTAGAAKDVSIEVEFYEV